MALELYCNNPSTTLASSLTSGATSLSVTSSTGYPGTGNFRILIDAELLLVTGVSGTTWTVTRGIEATTPTSHSSGANVNQLLTAGGLTQILADLPQIFSGTTDPNGTAVDFAPHDLTSNTSHSSYVVSSLSTYFLNPEWHAFDGGTYQYIGDNGGIEWLKLDLGSGNAQILGSYQIMFGTGTLDRGPMDFTMQGSNDNSTWTTVDTVTGETGWSISEIRTYTCDVATTAYRYFKLDITANNGNVTFTEIGELYLYSPAVPFSSGKDGDFYVDTTTRKMYGPKSGSAW